MVSGLVHTGSRIIWVFALCVFPLIAKPADKLPTAYFIRLIQETEKLELNDAVKFAHVNVPVKYHQAFMSYIQDAPAEPQPGFMNPLYYQWKLKDGLVVNGDVYVKDTIGYIAITMDGKQYVNAFSPQGIAQLKTLFKF